jgi:hypothetical protein
LPGSRAYAFSQVQDAVENTAEQASGAIHDGRGRARAGRLEARTEPIATAVPKKIKKGLLYSYNQI